MLSLSVRTAFLVRVLFDSSEIALSTVWLLSFLGQSDMVHARQVEAKRNRNDVRGACNSAVDRLILR